MTAVAEERYTSGIYALENPEWHEGEAQMKADAILVMLRRHDLRPKSIVDVGCGTGGVLELLHQALPGLETLVGYDIAPAAIEAARAKHGDGIRFEVGQPRSTETYDLLIALDVLEHVEDPWLWVRSIKNLAPVGMFHIPLDLTLHRVLRPGALPGIRARYGHLHYFTRELALRFLEESGYEIEDRCYTEEFRYESSGRPLAQALSVARRTLYTLQPHLAVRLLGGCRLLVLVK